MSENALSTAVGAAAPALPAGATTGFGGNGAKGMDAIKARVTGFMKQPAVAKSLPLLGLIGTVAVAGAAWLCASRRSATCSGACPIPTSRPSRRCWTRMACATTSTIRAR